MKRAPGISSATSRPHSTGTTRSPVTWRTSVGTRIVGRIARRLVCAVISISLRAIPGLTAERCIRPHHSTNSGLPTWLGANTDTSVPSPQLLSIASSISSRARPTSVCAPSAATPREHQRGHLVGIGGGEQRRQPQVRAADHRHPLGADRLQHGPQIVDLLLERRRLGHGVRQAGAAPVEHDQPGELRHRAEGARRPRLLPHQLQVRGGAGDHDQVARAVAQHLVGDAGIAAARVVGRWRAHISFLGNVTEPRTAGLQTCVRSFASEPDTIFIT